MGCSLSQQGAVVEHTPSASTRSVDESAGPGVSASVSFSALSIAFEDLVPCAKLCSVVTDFLPECPCRVTGSRTHEQTVSTTDTRLPRTLPSMRGSKRNMKQPRCKLLWSYTVTSMRARAGSRTNFCVLSSGLRTSKAYSPCAKEC